MFGSRSTNSAEQKPFILPQEDDCPDFHSRELMSKPRNQQSLAIYLHIALIFLYTLVSVVGIRSSTRQCSEPSKALSDLSIKYDSQIFDKMHDSPYVGPPSEPLDTAWQHLLANMSIRVTEGELQRHGQSSVTLPGGGHLAWLGVFHQLHCVLKKLTTPCAENPAAAELSRTLPSKHECEGNEELAGACGSLSRAPASGKYVSRGYDIFNNFYVVQEREADAESSEAAASMCGLG
ncbi:hypothetical protein GJ744_009424 [Endocarpon pusillum]|uniref:Uncharacterized protein n=1 Tax=Endocarpon pusillum TaxID=364733 RepID=A0A8H7AJ01_9EURO|nr:hypothetical protein GJ744_009424 [Endocarpon pusillum]